MASFQYISHLMVPGSSDKLKKNGTLVILSRFIPFLFFLIFLFLFVHVIL